MNGDFTLASYRDLMTALLQRGYEPRGYADVVATERHVILRHDIDMSLDAALPIAEIENALGLRAHYFVLLRTEMYNLFSVASRCALRRLMALGHEIGLHFDASLYENTPAALDRAVGEECAALEAAVGTNPTRVVSFHRPAKELLGHPGRVGGRIHVYQPSFYTDIGYCSDSRGAWHYGHPLVHAAVRDGRAIQLLTHPIWWNGGAGIDPVDKLNHFLRTREEFMREELARNCQPYRDTRAENIGIEEKQRQKS